MCKSRHVHMPKASGHDPVGSISTYWIKIQISQQPKSKAHNYGQIQQALVDDTLHYGKSSRLTARM